MRNLLFSLFAIGVAAVAAMTATTALLNAPHRHSALAETTTNLAPADTPATPAAAKPTAPDSGKAATPGGTPDTGKPAAAGAAKAGSEAKKDDDDDGDKDPYEGIAPEELPPDMQYNADSSVSFPTNI